MFTLPHPSLNKYTRFHTIQSNPAKYEQLIVTSRKKTLTFSLSDGPLAVRIVMGGGGGEGAFEPLFFFFR